MSTSLDGSPPSVNPDDPVPGDRPDPEGGRRSAPGPGEDTGAVWLQEEMRRRMDANTRNPRGRHARDDADTEQFGVDAIAARLRTGESGPPRPPARPQPPGGFVPRPGQGFPQGPPPQGPPPQGPLPPQAYAGPVGPPPAPAWIPVSPPAPAGHPVPPGPVEEQAYSAYVPEPPAEPMSVPVREPQPDPATGQAPVPAAEPGVVSYTDYADYDDDYDDEYDDYDEDEDDGVDLAVDENGEVERFERVLGPASVPLRMPPPQPYDLAGPPPGPLAAAPPGVRPYSAPMERAGRVAAAPDTLGGPPAALASPTTPVRQVDDDPERTDVGVLPPVEAEQPASVPPPSAAEVLSAALLASPAAAAAGTVAPSRSVGARFARVEEETEAPRRVRVVLSERKGVARTVRTVVDVQEGTAVGELLRANLIRGQLGVAARVGAVALLVVGLLPVLFAVYPELGRLEVLGLRLPWLLLGVLVYPFLLGLGWWHTKSAEKVEQNFADHVQD